MTTAVQHRRGTTAEHAAFTGLEGELTIDTTKDTAVIHDGTLAGGYPLAKENLANVTTSGLSSITGAATASDDKFFIYDQSATSLKTITRAELNNAIEQDALANVAITGGTINGTTIGGTTAAAVSATTLTTSSTVTLNGGTANGVAYLNGSKVLTTGSALVFDGANFTLNSGDFSIYSGGPTRNLTMGPASAGLQYNVDGNLYINSRSDGYSTAFKIGGSEKMRLTSTGLGIGTSSPSAKLHVNNGAGCQLYVGLSNNIYSQGYNHIWQNLSGVSTFMTLNESGNLGIGTSSPGVKLQVNNAATVGLGASGMSGISPIVFADNGSSANGSFVIKSHSVGNGNIIGAYRIASSPDGVNYSWAGMAAITSVAGAADTLTFYTAASNSAGATSVERLRIDSSGNVGIGTSSPAVKLDVVGAGVFRLDGSGSTTPLILRNNNAASTQLVKLGFDSSGTIKASINAAVFGNDFMTFNVGSDTERMRIDSSGNLGLGVTPTNAYTSTKSFEYQSGGIFPRSGETNFTFNATQNSGASWIYGATNSASLFQIKPASFVWQIAPSGTAGNAISFTQAMTLHASGGLSVGSTTDPGAGNISVGSNKFFGLDSNAKYIPDDGSVGGALYTGGGFRFFTGGANERMRIDSSGNLSVGTTTTATQISFNGSSGITYQRSTANSFAGVLDYLKSRGSAASPAAVQNGDDLFQLRVAPYQGSAYTYLNSQVVSVDGTFTSGQNPPTRIVWYTNTANGSATERARIDSSGNLLVGTTSAIGGSRVISPTGFTSRSVALTLNGTSTVTVPNGCICTMAADGFPGDSAIFSIKSIGGFQGCYFMAQGTAGNIGFGTTSNPSTGTRLNVWISGNNQMSIQDVGVGVRTIYLTFTAVS